jgi:hypothetical protein
MEKVLKAVSRLTGPPIMPGLGFAARPSSSVAECASSSVAPNSPFGI